MARYAFRRLCKRSWLVICVAMLLGGCASSPTVDSSGSTDGSQLLNPWQTITGALLQPNLTPAFGNLTKTGITGPLQFLSPTQVAVRNNLIYVVDAGYRQIFRYDATQMAMSRFAEYPAASIAGIVVAPDMSLYVVDPPTRKILHFSQDGQLLRPPIGSDQALARPVAIVLDESTGQLLVADNLYNHVVAFSSLGLPLGTLKSLHTRSIDAMARGPDGLYLVDRSGRQVVVIGLDGIDRYTFGEGVLKEPLAIVVDRYNRAFISDGFDNTIKVFEAGEFVAEFGGSVGSPLNFNRITSLAMDHGGLYVADSLNARIQIFHVAPPAVPETARTP